MRVIGGGMDDRRCLNFHSQPLFSFWGGFVCSGRYFPCYFGKRGVWSLLIGSPSYFGGLLVEVTKWTAASRVESSRLQRSYHPL